MNNKIMINPRSKIRNLKSLTPLWLLIAMLLGTATVHAQKKNKRSKAATDTLAIIKEFAAISKGYMQVPLYVEIDIKNSANYTSSPQDTQQVHAGFYLGLQNSYVRMGEVEQVVNDSMAVLVSDQLRQIIVFADAAPVVKQMRSMLGNALPDSSVKELGKKYNSISRFISPDTGAIELQSRTNLAGTALPRETITLYYDTKKREPQQVITMRRTLLQIDKELYEQLKDASEWLDKTVAVTDNYFLVKETASAYLFSNIKHGTTEAPVRISDRIVKGTNGEYEPVKQYAGYRLSVR